MYKSSPGLEAGATCNKSIRWSEMDFRTQDHADFQSGGLTIWPHCYMVLWPSIFHHINFKISNHANLAIKLLNCFVWLQSCCSNFMHALVLAFIFTIPPKDSQVERQFSRVFIKMASSFAFLYAHAERIRFVPSWAACKVYRQYEKDSKDITRVQKNSLPAVKKNNFKEIIG